jgi:AmpD protein
MANILNITSVGLLEPVKFRLSPHCDTRPPQAMIDLIIIHGISLPPGEFGSNAIENFFCGTLNGQEHLYYAAILPLHVSAHLLIKRSGEIVQFVPFTQRAWHAGESFFQGRPRCNDFSIGIELEGTDDIPYEQVQYEQLSRTAKLLMQRYPAITQDRIVGHCDVAPGRKTDPGPAFDWSYLKGILA